MDQAILQQLLNSFGLTGVFIAASYLMLKYFMARLQEQTAQMDTLRQELIDAHSKHTEDVNGLHELYAQRIEAKDELMRGLFEEVKSVFAKNEQATRKAIEELSRELRNTRELIQSQSTAPR